ncbi:MAG: hypothetical protein ACJAUG_000437 [Halioglobus sp.]|jgi:hypothetical protein
MISLDHRWLSIAGEKSAAALGWFEKAAEETLEDVRDKARFTQPEFLPE